MISCLLYCIFKYIIFYKEILAYNNKNKLKIILNAISNKNISISVEEKIYL